jgi:hypothetical protein
VPLRAHTWRWPMFATAVAPAATDTALTGEIDDRLERLA